MIAGVDWFRGLWLAALQDGGGATRLTLVESFSALIARPELERVVVDVPMGLPDAGARACDVAARRAIARRRSSVFPAPVRTMLAATSYPAACQLGVRADGRACSKQTYAILPIIRDVDAVITPALQSYVHEGHPELSFTALNAGAPPKHPKRTPEGRLDRLGLLRPHFPDLDERLASLRPASATTDAIDAYALLWSARRVREGHAIEVSGRVQQDGRGLRMEMFA